MFVSSISASGASVFAITRLSAFGSRWGIVAPENFNSPCPTRPPRIALALSPVPANSSEAPRRPAMQVVRADAFKSDVSRHGRCWALAAHCQAA